MRYEITADTVSGRKTIVETTALKALVIFDQIVSETPGSTVIRRNGISINALDLEQYAMKGDGSD